VGFLKRMLNRFSGIPNPSSEYMMEGYDHDQMGPKIFEGKGKDAVDAETARLLERGKVLKETNSPGGTPIGST
jgi:hypothetical protein